MDEGHWLSEKNIQNVAFDLNVAAARMLQKSIAARLGLCPRPHCRSLHCSSRLAFFRGGPPGKELGKRVGK